MESINICNVLWNFEWSVGTTFRPHCLRVICITLLRCKFPCLMSPRQSMPRILHSSSKAEPLPFPVGRWRWNGYGVLAALSCFLPFPAESAVAGIGSPLIRCMQHRWSNGNLPAGFWPCQTEERPCARAGTIPWRYVRALLPHACFPGFLVVDRNLFASGHEVCRDAHGVKRGMPILHCPGLVSTTSLGI